MFDKLFQVYLNQFGYVGEPYLITIANCPVPAKIVRMKYRTIAPIKTLHFHERRKLWNYARETFPNETKTFWKQFIIITYTIGTVI